MKRWDKLEQLGYTECIDSGYAESKMIYEQIKAKEEAKGHKLLRVKTDTPGLINYIVFAKKTTISLTKNQVNELLFAIKSRMEEFEKLNHTDYENYKNLVAIQKMLQNPTS